VSDDPVDTFKLIHLHKESERVSGRHHTET
jgi:hypothetical protein